MVVCEVEFNLELSNLDELDRKIHSFKRLNSYYQSYKLYGALAAFHVNEEAKNEALERGFYVARIQDETFSLDTPKEFQAKCF